MASSLRRAAVLIAALATMITMGAGAAAANASYLYRNNGGSIWASQSIGGSTGTLVASGRSFGMACYADGPWTNFYGNYWTNRYFRGIVYTPSGNFWAWVTASDVGGQIPVGHC